MNKWIKAASLGGLTGIRSVSGLRAAGNAYGYGRFNAWFGRMLFAESVMDKLPFMPSRSNPLLLVGRGTFGGLAGSGVARGKLRVTPERLLLGVVGAVSAIGASIACARMRNRLVKRSRVASTAMALGEDAVVLITSRKRRLAA